MNEKNNGRPHPREDYEVSAIYDDAGTPPREEWLRRKEVLRMKTREKRQEQFRRIEQWLSEFHRTSPVIFNFFCLGIGLFVSGLLLTVLEWLGQ